MRQKLVRAVVLVILAAGLTGCAGRFAYRQGKADAKEGNWDMAVARFTRALQKSPENIEYKLALENAKLQASRYHYGEAKKHLAAANLEKAADELDIARKYDPSNQAYASELEVVKERIQKRENDKKQRAEFDTMKQRADAVRAPVPMLSPRDPVPITINMPDASLQKVFETLAQLSGVNILFDPDVRDKQYTAKLKGVTFQEALEQLTFVNRLFYKVLDQNTLIIAPENPNKRRQYDENLLKTFYLQSADINEVSNALRIILQGNGGPLRLAPVNGPSALAILGNVDEIALATQVVDALDKPAGEVMVEVEIIDVSRSHLKKYGIELANYSGSLSFAPYGAPSANTDIRAHLLSSFNLSDFVVNIPSQLLFNFLQNDTNSRILASPRLRAAAGKMTSLRVGTEVPIPITTFTATNTGNNGSFSPATSFQYRTVGINLEMTPKINADGDVRFDPLKAEFSLPGVDKKVGDLLIPEFLTRLVNGTLVVHDGETALIGGLIQGQEKEAFSGIVGLQSIPILNRLFSAPDKSKDDSEILISLTPHIVRGPKLRDSDLVARYVGTKEIVKVPGAQPPLLGTPEPPPTAVPTTAPPAPTTPPVGVAPPPPPAVPGAPSEDTTPPATATPAPPVAPPTPPPAIPQPAVPGGAVDEAQPVTVLFSPPEVNGRPGDIAVLSIVVLRVKDLISADLVVAYDPESLDAVDVDPGSLLSLDGATVGAEKSLVGGRVHAHFTRQAGTSGSGAIASIRFRAKKVGPSSVTLESLAVVSPGGRQKATLPGPARIVVTQ